MLSEIEVLAACSSEIQGSSITSELAAERAKAMRYYLGEPYGDEKEDRSRIITREVLESVEWILPSLMRTYMDEENTCSFDPVGPEDEDAAEQEMDAVNHVFWEKNPGFFNLLTSIKDGLLSKTGWLKIWWDESEDETREEYSGIEEMDAYALMTDGSINREVVEVTPNENGGLDISFLTTQKTGKVRIMPCTPEDVGVNSDASSPLVEDCRFIYHEMRKTKSDLREEGFPQDLIDKIPTASEADDEESRARRHLDDERNHLSRSTNEASQTVWVTENYIKLDRNEDGVAELLKVVTGGAVSIGSSGGSNVVLSIDEIDSFPFVAWTPIILTHKFTGLSIADLQMDVQYAKSTLLRQMFDNMYRSNNTEKAVNERVKMEDMMVSMPGGVKRVKGTGPVAEAIMPMVTPQLPPQSFDLITTLDDMTKGRTGIGAETAALDVDSLANVNTGVAAISYDAARARIELIARMGAEFLLKEAFRRVHELLSKNAKADLQMKLRGEWVDVHPGEWRRREDITVNVGIGRATTERKIIALERIMEKQALAVQNGGLGVLVTPQNLYSSLHDYSRLLGGEADRYWTDPRTLEQPEPEESPQEKALAMQAQIEQMKLQMEARKLQIDEAKLKLDAEARIVDQSLKQRELKSKQDIEQLKAEMGLQKQAIDEQSQIMNAQATLGSKEADVALRTRELELKEFLEKNKLLLEVRGQEIDKYKAELTNAVKMMGDMQKQIDAYAKRTEAMAQASEMDGKELRGAISGKLEELINQLDEPITVQKDGRGNVIRIGGMAIEPEEDG